MNIPAASPAVFDFDNSYARLPDRFYAHQLPTPMPAPGLIRLNVGLAQALGLSVEALSGPDGARLLTGTVLPEGAQPISMVYGGHQFGGWAGRLGDGRAVLLGEVLDADGIRYDIHLKGAGRTPFSRSGDGRAALGPVLREYVVSEAMHAFGIPTSRALAALYTGETVMREAPMPGALLVRVARSHVRVGTFEYFRAAGDEEGLRVLAEYVIDRHFPELAESDNPVEGMLLRVLAGQARLIAKWMHVGFIHGVMNTDNTQLAGETIDYGPCAFMDGYVPAKVFSSIDYMGRYAYANQPRIGHWNVASLARTLLPLLHKDESRAVEIAQRSVDGYPALYEAAWLDGMRAKLGLEAGHDGDQALAEAFLELLAAEGIDFSLAFRHLSNLELRHSFKGSSLDRLFENKAAVASWLEDWRSRLALEGREEPVRIAGMRAVNPAFIPRNHLVEACIAEALAGDVQRFQDLAQTLARPFEDQPGREWMMEPPAPDEVVARTFCGT